MLAGTGRVNNGRSECRPMKNIERKKLNAKKKEDGKSLSKNKT